jgi:type VI protein secretion system component Hcp
LSRGQEVTFLVVEFANVSVNSYKMKIADDAPPLENVTFNYEEINVTYTEYNPDGSKRGAVEYECLVPKGE